MGHGLMRRTACAALAALAMLPPATAVAEPNDGLVLWYREHPLGPIEFTTGPRARATAPTATAVTPPEPPEPALDERRTPLGGGWQATTFGRDIRWAEVGSADATLGAGLGTAMAPDRVHSDGPQATGVAGQARTGLALPLGEGAAATAEVSRTYAGSVSEMSGDGTGLVEPRTDQVTIGAKLKF